ncbi:hypothetical protein GCM10010317_044920 [Streptomyces mirabilis]|nr:hypothetical protein GCM10010317_044920 [Streptomyces mirabilis]
MVNVSNSARREWWLEEASAVEVMTNGSFQRGVVKARALRGAGNCATSHNGPAA